MTRSDEQLVLLAKFYDLSTLQGILIAIEQARRLKLKTDETKQLPVLV
jgi:energy-converting hydrogenase A subunit M